MQDNSEAFREFSTRTKWEPSKGDFLDGVVRYIEDGNYEVFDGLTLWFLYDMPSLSKEMCDVNVGDSVYIKCVDDDEFDVRVR